MLTFQSLAAKVAEPLVIVIIVQAEPTYGYLTYAVLPKKEGTK